MPSIRFFVALLCGSLVVAQISFVFLSNADGVVDRSFFPEWAQRLLPEPDNSPPSVATPKSTAQSDPVPVPENPAAKPADVSLDTLFKDEKPEEVVPASIVLMIKAKATASAIRILDSSGQIVGSGVVIRVGNGYFDAITASHVLTGMPNFWVEAMRNENSAGVLSIFRSADASLLSEDRDSDLAHIRVLSPFSPAASLHLPDDFSSVNEPNAATAWAVDFTVGELPSTGEVKKAVRRPAKRASWARTVTYWQLQTASKPGMSGSALFDQDSNLMGIASGNGDGVAYYTAESEVRRFLEPVLQSVLPEDSK